MSNFIVKDTSRGNTRECETRSEAEETKKDLISLGAKPEDLEIIPPGETDGGETVDAEVVEDSKGEVPDVSGPNLAEEFSDDIPDKPPVDEDPVDWMPEHFIDEIQGVPTVNRKGYAVIAAKYGVSVKAEPVTLPSETDFEYAEFRATAETEDGQTYTGFGSAHIDRQDGDDAHLLGELAETRAMKRATAWATGVGMTAASEMMGEL